MVKEIRFKYSFPVRARDGRPDQIDVSVEIIAAGTTTNPDAEKEGMQHLQTSSGMFVNYLEKGKYQVRSTGEILTSRDSAAP
jgi:hypothetical protein